MSLSVLNNTLTALNPRAFLAVLWAEFAAFGSFSFSRFPFSDFYFFSLHVFPSCPLYTKTCLFTVWSGFILAFCPARSVSAGLGSSQVVENVTMWTEESSFCFTCCANVGGGKKKKKDFKEATENLIFLDQSSYHPVQKVIANAV